MRAFWLLTRTHDSVSPERVTASNRTGLILQDKQRQESGVSGHGGSPCGEARRARRADTRSVTQRLR